MASFPIGTFVESFLDREKEDARRLIRHEMEAMLDPLVESLFGQLKAKFVDYVDAHKGLHEEHQVEQEDDGKISQEEPSILNTHQYHSQSLDNVNSIDANFQINSTNHLEPPLMLIKEEINDSLNVKSQQNYHSVNSSPSPHESSLFPGSMIAPSSTDNFPGTEIQQQPQPQQRLHIKHNQFDDDEDKDECDCNECVYGSIEVKEEEDDDDWAQWIEDDQEEDSSPHVKRPRMDSTQNSINSQPAITNQFPRQSTDEAQPNQVNIHDKQFITVRLHCPELGCLDTFGENELNDHLMDEHSIGPNRCLVKDCKQSFDNHRILGQHIKQAHKHTSQWHCSKCSKHFSKYQLLFEHNTQFHQLGQFQCAFPSCTFTGECRVKVYNHYQLQHKPDLVCQLFGCEYRTKKSSRFKAHQRAHLGIKPYRCKCCDYSNASQDNTMKHIKANHFSGTSSSTDVPLSGKPKDYLEVVHSLL